jgi:hypothetical protein
MARRSRVELEDRYTIRTHAHTHINHTEARERESVSLCEKSAIDAKPPMPIRNKKTDSCMEFWVGGDRTKTTTPVVPTAYTGASTPWGEPLLMRDQPLAETKVIYLLGPTHTASTQDTTTISQSGRTR